MPIHQLSTPLSKQQSSERQSVSEAFFSLTGIKIPSKVAVKKCSWNVSYLETPPLWTRPSCWICVFYTDYCTCNSGLQKYVITIWSTEIGQMVVKIKSWLSCMFIGKKGKKKKILIMSIYYEQSPFFLIFFSFKLHSDFPSNWIVVLCRFHVLIVRNYELWTTPEEQFINWHIGRKSNNQKQMIKH